MTEKDFYRKWVCLRGKEKAPDRTYDDDDEWKIRECSKNLFRESVLKGGTPPPRLRTDSVKRFLELSLTWLQVPVVPSQGRPTSRGHGRGEARGRE